MYDYTDTAGKRHYTSFTADTKKEAEYIAAEFALEKNDTDRALKDYSLIEGMNQYINLKRNILSPSTPKEYERMAAQYYPALLNRRMSSISKSM